MAGASTQGVPYDFKSVMHFDPTAFSCNGDDTIVHSDPDTRTHFGISILPDIKDYFHINILYCDGKKIYVETY